MRELPMVRWQHRVDLYERVADGEMAAQSSSAEWTSEGDLKA